jgi:hypothetical protein
VLRPTILIVDDHDDRRMLVEYFRSHAYATVVPPRRGMLRVSAANLRWPSWLQISLFQRSTPRADCYERSNAVGAE